MTVYPYLEKTAINPVAPITIARSASFSVYDLNDTGYLTPLNVTRLSDGATVTTLLSDSNGYIPDFTVIDRTSVVIKSGTFIKTLVTSVPIPGAPGGKGDPGIKGDKGDPGDVPTWKASTYYPLNQIIVNPSAQLVVVTTAHTSTTTYDPTQFAPSNAEKTANERDTAYRPFYGQVVEGDATVYILGHSVVAGTGASVPLNSFANIVKAAVTSSGRTSQANINGQSGKTSSDILASFASNGVNTLYTSLTIFMGLLNDYLYNIPPATSGANILALAARMRTMQPAGSPDPGFLVLLEWLRGDVPSPAYPWESYRQAAFRAADTDPTITILDLGTRMGPSSGDKDGLYLGGSNTHPNDKGHALIARLVLDEIGLYKMCPPIRPAMIQFDPRLGGWSTKTGTWATVIDPKYIGNSIYTNSTQVVGDSVGVTQLLSPGLWRFDIFYATDSRSGIITVEMDDGAGLFTSLGTIDAYSATDNVQALTTFSADVFGPRFSRALRLTVTDKNAASASYHLNLRAIVFRHG